MEKKPSSKQVFEVMFTDAEACFQRCYFFQRSASFGFAAYAFGCGGDHHVFGSVLGGDELEHLGFVAFGFEQQGADAIGHYFGLALFEDTVAQQRRQFVAGVHFLSDLFVATGRCHDNFRLVPDAGVQCQEGIKFGISFNARTVAFDQRARGVPSAR